jgi:hypothetical protein
VEKNGKSCEIDELRVLFAHAVEHCWCRTHPGAYKRESASCPIHLRWYAFLAKKKEKEEKKTQILLVNLLKVSLRPTSYF